MLACFRRGLLLAIALGCSLGLVAHSQAQDSLPEPLSGPNAKAGYGIGLQFGRQLAQGGFDAETLDLKSVVLGVRDALAGKEPRISQEEFQQAMQSVMQVAQEKMKAKMETLSTRNQDQGPKFLAKFKSQPGVEETASGLLYKVVSTGDGAKPAATDRVKTNYRGRLIDGTEFDSSYKRNQPAEFNVNEVIPGWTEALQMMAVGSKWQLAIPSNLAYAEAGRPPVIGPHAVLVFEIELLDIVPAQQQPEE